MTGYFVADDDQPQILINGVAFQFPPEHGERFHQTRDVLLRPYGADVQQEGVVNLIPIQGPLPLVCLQAGCILEEFGIRRVVDLANSVGSDAEKTLDVAPRGIRDRDYPGGALQPPPELV